MYKVEILDARELSDDDARAIAELIVKVWPKPDKTINFRQEQMLDLGRNYVGPDDQAPRSTLIRESGRVIAHAAFIPRSIGTTVGDMTVAGLCRVCSDPDFRGLGLGEVVVREIFKMVDDKTFPFSLFQTNSRVQPFYERLGSCIVSNPIVNSLATDLQPPFRDEIAMRYPKDGNWPDGIIDLRGPGY